ncbi:C6 zinc finger domain protein [Aspergillus leporis]|uniref:C6 zinc finger domain protein n=1 Tax=Aspergillus leporis TaxID=41062 RepID=A0A5N5WKQ8_9EURO|nr:C6 zinc finger domain protein [Aspergillus leporis]
MAFRQNIMGLPSIHPSQRRFSCEVCRRQKSKCQRIQRNDLKCARCTILRVECITGQQKKVGRPKQAVDSVQNVSKIPGSKSSSTTNERNLPGRLREFPSFPNVDDGLGRSSIISPAAMPIPAPFLVTAAPHAFVPTPTWSSIGMLSFHQDSSTSSITKTFDDGFPLSNFDSTFGSTTADSLSCDTAANSIDCAPTALVIPGPESVGGGIESSDAIAKLSKINLDLHIRVAAIEKNRTILDLNSLIYRESALFIDNYTLAVFILKTSQDFVQILTLLLNSRQCHGPLCTSQKSVTLSLEPVPLPLQSYQHNYSNPTSTFSLPYPSAASQPLLAPLALTITSIFTQLISLYELFLEHLTTRIERLSTDPVAPIPGFTFGGLPLVEPCTQGLLFSNGVVHLLERMERALGISEPEAGEVLWSELDGGIGITPVDGTVRRPANMKKLLGKMAIIFSRLALVNKQ